MRDSATPQPPALLHQYLARHGFAPHPGNSAWLERDTGQQIIRVCHDPGEATLLYCLTPNTVCLYEAVFSPGTPDAVIIAAIQTAFRSPPPQTEIDPRQATSEQHTKDTAAGELTRVSCTLLLWVGGSHDAEQV